MHHVWFIATNVWIGVVHGFSIVSDNWLRLNKCYVKLSI
jgi:hypothetical protein